MISRRLEKAILIQQLSNLFKQVVSIKAYLNITTDLPTDFCIDAFMISTFDPYSYSHKYRDDYDTQHLRR